MSTVSALRFFLLRFGVYSYDLLVLANCAKVLLLHTQLVVAEFVVSRKITRKIVVSFPVEPPNVTVLARRSALGSLIEELLVFLIISCEKHEGVL